LKVRSGVPSNKKLEGWLRCGNIESVFLLGKERNPKKKQYMIKGKKGEGTRDKKTSLRAKKMIREKC